MGLNFSLQAAFLSQMKDVSLKSIMDLELTALLNQQVVNGETLLDDCNWKISTMSQESSISNWKTLLGVSFLHHLSDGNIAALRRKVREFEAHPWNQTSQFLRVLVSLCHQLAKMTTPEVGIHLLESGAALIDIQEHSPWLSLPYHPRHIEFGVYLCALNRLSPQPSIEKHIKRLVEWQLNALDANGKPIASLFVKEKDGDYFELLVLYYLLFRGAAFATQDSKYWHYSQTFSEELSARYHEQIPLINPLWVLLEKILASPIEAVEKLDLPCQIYDSSTSLIGYRSEQKTALCTLHGGHTGLGYVRYDDVEIVNYGPQYLPLDDCRGFGIEGNHLSDHGIRRSIMEWNRQGFSLKGCVRLVDQPAEKGDFPIQQDKYRGIWLDIGQEFKGSQLHLKTTFMGLDGWEGVGFSFFVRADQCRIHHGISLLPGNLNHYKGDPKPIFLKGKNIEVEINSAVMAERMQVIPLSGGNNFWGANFLVAYLLNAEQRDYDWTIRCC